MSLLRLESISRHFGSLVALQDVSLEMAAGELRAVIGPNGAGKTTLFNMVSGFFPPSSGRVFFEGQPINADRAEARVRRGIVRTFQITEIFHELNVYENVCVAVETAAGLNSRPWVSRETATRVRRRIDELLALTGLAAKADRVASELAHGDQRVVEVAIALAMRPRSATISPSRTSRSTPFRMWLLP